MKLSLVVAVVAADAIASSVVSHLTKGQHHAIDYNHAPPNLSTLANGSLFETWRPRAHVLPPTGQIGDPCMHYTDPNTGLFHVGWLHGGASGATTDDLATYHDLNTDGRPFIVAGGVNDPIAVFDGSVIPIGIDGKPTLLETQSLAVSSDGGRNFTKLRQGPVIPSPPFAVNVTAFRDPFVFQNSKLDSLLESSPQTWYTVISGGVHGDGPSQFLYRQHDPDFQYWEYLGQWWHEAANSTWGSGDWAGQWGFNFEVGNVFSLDTNGYNAEGDVFTTIGAEWSFKPIVPEVSDSRQMLWAAGNVTLQDGEVKFTPNMAGFLDWGSSAYAAAGKELPADSQASMKSNSPDRFITYLWLTGDFYATHNFPTLQQNWTGALLFPRELSVGTISNVVDNELSRETGSWRVASNNSGVLELTTLRQEIARETMAELASGTSFTEPGQRLDSPGTVGFKHCPKSKFYVLSASLSFPASARGSDLKAGFEVLSSEFETTKIYYQFSNESIIIDRTNSSAASKTTDGIDARNESGKLRLFDIMEHGKERIETLELTIVVDNSIVEVHANSRFAVSTWARSWYTASKEIRFLVDGEGEVEFGKVTIHEGLFDAWPERNR
ncbi:hypothetical protein O988_03218 [Pseudogymnoascus sp. VKM F-3808]|nr:hypothetical protein O988_03218 [Pseudogymnoascus sp. VKM F-3808]